MSQEKTIITLPLSLLYAIYEDDVAKAESIFETNKFNINQEFDHNQLSIVEKSFQFHSEKVLSYFLEKGADASKIKIDHTTRKEFFFKHISELITNGFDLLDNLPSIMETHWSFRTPEIREQHKNTLDDNLMSFIIDKKIDINLKIKVIGGGGVLMQIKVGPETKFVCGRNSAEYELITLSTIPVEAIKSITIVGTGQIISNPNYIESALDNTKPLAEEEMIANYKAMGCEQYVESNAAKMKAEGELSSYEKFIETFTPSELAEHRKKVYLAADPEMCFVE
jgi:hypothetical protein